MYSSTRINEELRKRLGVQSAIDYIKRQQIKWFGHIIRQKDLNIIQKTMNKHYENTRPKGRPKKRWIEGILNSLGNISIAEATKKARHRKLYLPSISTTSEEG
jgi:hypothetical protein